MLIKNIIRKNVKEYIVSINALLPHVNIKMWDKMNYFNQAESKSDLYNLSQKRKKQLIELCKKYHYKTVGKKDDLIKKLYISKQQHINNAILKFINTISTDLNINKLKEIWKNMEKKDKTDSTFTIQYNFLELSSYKKTMLQSLCKNNKLSTVGNKNVLIQRLLHMHTARNTNTNICSNEKKKNNKKKSPFDKICKSYKKRLQINLEKYQKYDNLYIWSQYGYIFNNDFKVIGKQLDTNMVNINKKDVIYFQENNIDFIMPYNLNDVAADV